jgi:hypothetical protein
VFAGLPEQLQTPLFQKTPFNAAGVDKGVFLLLLGSNVGKPMAQRCDI